MVAILVLLFRKFLSRNLVEQARAQAEKGIAGRMEGHAEMDMSVPETGSFVRRIASKEGVTAISHYFVMDWASVWLDIAVGLLISGALAAWVPHDLWRFLKTGGPKMIRMMSHPTHAQHGGAAG